MLRLKKAVFSASHFYNAFPPLRTASSSACSKRVGLIGTGNVGSAVLTALRKAGFQVKAHDLQQKNYEILRHTGAQLLDSAEAVTEDIDVLITALPKPRHVKAVMEDDKLLFKLKKGSIWIDHTTTDYHETLRLGGIASDLGVHTVEAPLTGGMALLKEGVMTVFVGGEKDAVQECRPLIDCYTGTFLYFGALGKATIAKVISNMLAGVHLIAAGEALMLGKKAGLNMDSFFDGIRTSAGNSYVFETEVPLMFQGSYDPNFTIDLHCKDLVLGREMAKEHGVPLEILQLTDKMYHRAMEKYGGDVGSSSPAKMIEDDVATSQYRPGWDKWSYTMERVTGGGIGVIHKNRPESH